MQRRWPNLNVLKLKTHSKKTAVKKPATKKKKIEEKIINKLTDILGCDYPIIQTAMGWVAMPQLVAATSNAGAFGFLALATAGPQEAIEMIDETMSLTNNPLA